MNRGFLALAVAALRLHGRVAAQSASTCLPADAQTTRTLSTLQTIVAGTDSVEAAYRDSVRLEATDPSNVSLVTDSRTCDKALEAINASWNTPGLARNLYVYKIGTFYGVESPLGPEGPSEYRGIYVYDRRWRYTSTILTF